MSLIAHLPALPVLVPLLTAPMVALLRDSRLSWLTAVLASGMSFALAIQLVQVVLDGGTLRYDMGGWAAPQGIELRIDALAALLLLVVTGASTAALLAGRESLGRQIGEARLSVFLCAWLLALAGLVGILVSGDAFNIFVFMEISSLATYILVGGGPHRRALPAVFKYLVAGTVGATFYLIGVGMVYMVTGTLNIADMEARLATVGDTNVVYVAAGFITIGLALKAAIFPMHAWMPNAYTFAPHIATAFIAACSTKVSLYVLLRMDFFVFQKNLTEHVMQFAYVLMPLAVLGILFGSLAAVFERNLKRLLAFSSVAQIGYILLGVSLISVAGFNAAVLHLFNHALAKSALFLSVACLGLHFSRMRLADLRGAGRQMPWTLAAFALAGLSLIGVPGTAGFISKWALILAALESWTWSPVLVVLIVASSLLSVIYIGRVVETLWFGERPEGAEAVSEAPAWMLTVTWTMVLANVYFGLDPSLPYELAGRAAEAFSEALAMSPEVAILAALFVPLAGAFGIALCGRWPNLRETVTLVTATALLGVVWAMLPEVMDGQRPTVTLGEPMPGVAIVFQVEPLGMLFAALASLLWLINSVYSIGYMRGNKEQHQTRFYACFAIALAATMGVAMSGNLLTLFLCYEVLTISTYPLVAHKGDAATVRSARTYLGLLLGTSIGLFLPAILWTYAATGSVDFVPGGIIEGHLSGPAVGLLLGLYAFGVGKAALMPVHRWLPAAMVAPTPVSALLHAVAVVKAGVFTLTKVIVYIFGLEFLFQEPSAQWLMPVAAFTLLAASAVALRQENLKRLLAYSTISQLAYIVMAASVLKPLSEIGAAIHMVSHAFGKITLFFAAGAIYVAARKTEIRQLHGIGRRMPWTMTAFTIGALSMVGVPPTAGFVSKWYILGGSLQAENYLAVFTLVASTVLNAAYFLPILYRAWLRPETELPKIDHGEAPWPMVLALTLTAALTLLFFLYNQPALDLEAQLLEGTP